MEDNQNQEKELNEKLDQEIKSEEQQKTTVNTEEIKNETAETVKQVKESMKNVNVKEEAKATKGFVGEMFKNPLEKIEEIANDTTNKHFKTAIVLVIIWTIAALLGTISFKYFRWYNIGNTLLGYIKVILVPVLIVVVMSAIIYLMNKKTKRSLTTILTTVTAAKLPIIIAKVISLLSLFSYSITTITSRITSFCSIISTVFMYFAIKSLYGEKEEKTAFKNFAIIEAIYIIAAFVIAYLGINI